MQSQLYRNVEHPGLGLLQVLEANPIEGNPELFSPSHLRYTTVHRIDYDYAFARKKSGLYNVLVRDDQGLEFTMRNAFWDSFVPVSQESPVSKEKPLVKYGTWVNKAASASTKEYFGMLRDIFKKRGIGTALSLDFDTTIERLMNFCNILENKNKIVRSEK